MNSKIIVIALLLGLCMLGNNGCALVLLGAGGAAGAGTVAYIGGELKASEQIALDRAWSGTQAAMDSLGFTVTSKEKDAISGELIARGASDKKITVKLKKQTDEVTEIRIRIGTFGDESMSRQILEEIKKRA